MIVIKQESIHIQFVIIRRRYVIASEVFIKFYKTIKNLFGVEQHYVWRESQPNILDLLIF